MINALINFVKRYKSFAYVFFFFLNSSVHIGPFWPEEITTNGWATLNSIWHIFYFNPYMIVKNFITVVKKKYKFLKPPISCFLQGIFLFHLRDRINVGRLTYSQGEEKVKQISGFNMTKTKLLWENHWVSATEKSYF